MAAPILCASGQSRSRTQRCLLDSAQVLAEFGSGGSGGGVIFVLNTSKRLARQPRRIIQFHFGLITFRIHCGKTRKVINCMVFGASGRDHDSQSQYHLSMQTPGYSKSFKKNADPFLKHLIFGNLKTSKIGNYETCGKDVGRTIPKIRFINSWES